MENLPPENSLILYQTEDGQTRIEVRLLDETVWLSQAQMCDLFDKDKRTISEHIQNIFKEGELLEEAVVRKFRTTASDGKKYQIAHYNLDVIISCRASLSGDRQKDRTN
ncbi:MAG: hypothetical protein WA347_01995 [Rhabdochlamydiaceae bacterium]|jgi:hypothetical protein